MMAPIMAVLALASLAQAGQYGEGCEFFAPIAGTAGFANAQSAVRTQANTYGAGEFARRRLRDNTWFAFDMHIVAGAAQVPSWCADQEGRFIDEGYSQPLDLGATNVGLNAPLLREGPFHSRAHVFYAASVTQSVMGARALSWSLPLLNLYPAVAAPAVGRMSSGRGLSVYTLDWIGGAYLKSDIVSVQAGYTGTRGLYVDVSQDKAALFVNTVLDDGLRWSDAAYLMAGIQQFDPLALGASDDKAGMTSLFYRDLDQGEDEEEAEPIRVAQNEFRLRTGHLRQEDMFRRLDVRAAWQFGADPRLRELAAALHHPDWYPRAGLDRDDAGTWYVRAGVVSLPDQPLLGVKGGMRPTLRADYEHQVGSAETYGMRVSARVNDPDLLDLYPFAYDALGLNFELTYTGSP